MSVDAAAHLNGMIPVVKPFKTEVELMSTEVEVDTLKAQFPSTDLAYQIALTSYDAMTKRLDAIDGRIQTLLAFAATTSALVPSIGAGRGLSFASPWFIAAMILIFLAILIGSYARLGGKVNLLDPKSLYDGWLHFSEPEFKLYLIEHAAKDFEANDALLTLRWRLAVCITILFFLEAALLVVWVAAVGHP